ncbi:MAG: hypothetical protein WA208_17300 [Thermoanaerobaculia bacterium]
MNRNPNREQIMVQYSADTNRSTAKSVRVLLAVLLVTIATMAMAPAALAQTCPTGVTLTAPANGSTGVATQGTLTWSTPGNVAADYFNVYFGATADNPCASTTPDLVTPGGTTFYMQANYFDLAPNTQYSWKVEAVKNGCTTVVSSCQTFTTSACHSNGPTLINPPDAATDDHLTVVFAWDPILGSPTGYEVFVAINGVNNPSAPFVSQGTTNATTFELTKVIPAGMHRWYVQGILPGTCAPARSATWTFGTACPTGAPSLVTPSSGQAISSPTGVNFSWSAVSGADGYDVIYSRNGGTEVRLTGPREGTELAGTSLTATLPGPGTYTWRVEALSAGCGNLTSANGTFTVTDICPTAGVTLTAPANNAASVTSPVAFSWNAQPNATTVGLTGYKVYVAISGATAGVVAEVNASTTTATFTAPTGTHSWFVESLFTNCAPVRSSTFTFTVPAASTCPTTAPTLLTPAAGATGVASPVTFSWEPVAGRSYYSLRIEGIATIITTSTSNTRVIPEGPRNWSVTAYFSGCPSVTSATSSFTVGTVATCPTAAPVLSTPAANATITREPGELVSFVWEPVAGATSYTLTVGTIATVQLTGTIYNLDVPNGTVNWSVAANYGGSCAPVASAARTLTVNAPPPCVLNTPALIQPTNNSETLSPTVVFGWSSVPNATEYRVYRRTGAGSADRELLGTTTDLSLERTFDFLDLTFGTDDLSPLEWYVEAHGGARCTHAQSARSTMKFRKAKVCSTDRPVLQSPAAGNSTTSRTIQFNWDRVTGATGYNVWTAFNGGAPTKLNGEMLNASTRSAEYSMPLGVSEWWVEAIYPGCPGVESLHRTLTITAPCVVTAPTISGPDGTTGTFTSPVTLSWTRVANATTYDVYIETDTSPMAPVATVSQPAGSGNITFVYSAQPGGVTWKVRANVPNCGSAFSAEARFTVVAPPPCTTPDAPRLTVQRKASSNQSYIVGWRQVANALSYEIDESTSASFTAGSITTQTVTGTQTMFNHEVAVDTTYYYRVLAKSSCNNTISVSSQVEDVTVEAPAQTNDSNLSVGAQEVVVQSTFFANPFNAPTPFTARTDVAWLRVSPASGTMPAAGITLSIVADPRDLVAGTNAGTILVEFTTAGANGTASQATTVYTVPVTVNLVTPVSSQGKTEPPSDALIIPAVAAADGANNSQWVSDIRVTNASGEPGRYQVNFTPSQNDAGRVSNQTTIDVPAGSSMALDSVLRNWFGARPGQSLSGVVEVRSLKSGATTSNRRGRTLLGSSRTYNRTASGTYGQFIPAIPVSDFVGKGNVLTLSEINQSATARTNLGLVEGSGQGANVRVTVFDANGAQLTTFDQYLRAGEHIQMNSFLGTRGITNDNARVNVEVTSDTGRVMAYASVVDNQTNDPLLVTGDVPVADTAWVLAGVADLDTGAARWRTDVRIYNPTASTVNANLIFYPSGDPTASKTIPTSIGPRSTKELKDILRNSFALAGVGGSVHVTTAVSTPLLVTARTFNLTPTGSYGQFIPGVPKSEGLGVGEGTVQLQQLESSAAYRTNLGVAEVSGKGAKVELIAVIPGSLATPRVTVDLKANEFVQLVNVFSSKFGLNSEIYNARIAVRVIEGDGKIIGYASVIDQKTQDPTFVPAER